MRGVPRLDKSALCLIRIRLVANLLNSDLCAVFREDDVLLFHLLDAAFSELIGVEEDLIAHPSQASNDRKEDHKGNEVRCAHGCGGGDVVSEAGVVLTCVVAG
jgi:hypothetical protein